MEHKCGTERNASFDLSVYTYPCRSTVVQKSKYTVSQKSFQFLIHCYLNIPAPICMKFGKQKEESHSYRTHIVILKLFHFYLFIHWSVCKPCLVILFNCSRYIRGQYGHGQCQNLLYLLYYSLQTTFCLINISGRSTYSSVHCRCQRVSCCSRLSVEQSSIAHHCCPLSPSSAVVSQITSRLTVLSHFLTLLSFVKCMHSDSSFWTLHDRYYILHLVVGAAAESCRLLS